MPRGQGEREYEYEPPSNFAGVGTNFANFDDIDFAAALAEYGEDKVRQVGASCYFLF